MGERGAPGPAGSSYRPVFWVSCDAKLDIIRAGASGPERAPDGMAETGLEYTVVVYSNADLEVQCGANIGSAQSGASSEYYPAITKGASTGVCLVNADFPPGPVVGYWSFAIEAALPHAAYVDPDNPLGLNGYSYSFSETDCHADMLGDNAKWTQVTLADVF
jgi:hypothetical protein